MDGSSRRNGTRKSLEKVSVFFFMHQKKKTSTNMVFTFSLTIANKIDHEVHEEPIDEMPRACYICREQFTDPVVTKCGHFFCEACAFKHHKKSKKCAVCNEPTGGVFNIATKLIAYLKKKDQEEKDKPQQPEEGVPADGEKQNSS